MQPRDYNSENRIHSCATPAAPEAAGRPAAAPDRTTAAIRRPAASSRWRRLATHLRIADYRAFLRLYRIEVNWNSPLRYLLWCGDGCFWLFFIALIYLLGLMKDAVSLEHTGILLLSGLVLSLVTSILPKELLKRKRPYADRRLQAFSGMRIRNRDRRYGARENESFPSGHVHFSSLGLVALTHQFQLLAFVPALLVVAMMVFARPNLGVHFLSDSLAGLVLGGLTSWIAIQIFPHVTLPLYSHTIALLSSAWAPITWTGLTLALALMFKLWQRRI